MNDQTTSPPVADTIDLTNPFVVQALSTLPPEWQELTPVHAATDCWLVPAAMEEVRRQLPWYRGVAPRLVLHFSGEVRVVLKWADGDFPIRISSGVFPTFREALDEAIVNSAVHGRDEDLDWSALAGEFLKAGVKAKVTMTNVAPKRVPYVVCQIRLEGVARDFAAPPQSTRRSAFERTLYQVASHIGARVSIPPAWRSEPRYHVMPKSRVWAVEHTWLSAQPFRTDKQDLRAARLRDFLQITDAQFITAARKSSLLALAHTEIEEQERWSTPAGARDRLAPLLRALCEGSESEDQLEPSPGFAEACAQHGLRSVEALQLLREASVVRPESDFDGLTPAGRELLVRAAELKTGRRTITLQRRKGAPITPHAQQAQHDPHRSMGEARKRVGALASCRALGELMSAEPDAFLQKMIDGIQQFASPSA